MAILYVKEQGAMVQKLGERIVVTKNSKTLVDVPIIRIDNVSIIGNVQISTQALRMLMEHGIDISYFTYGGQYLGHTFADSSKNIFLRFEQHNFYLNTEKRLQMSKMIISNKIQNQMNIIKYHKWSSDDNHDWRADLKQMKNLKLSLAEKKTPNEILGVEGMCSNIYFGAFGKMIKGDFKFETRNRRPPRDPVNIILSLAYTFLTREICNMLDAESFETYLGVLHGIRYGRKSLALDLIEEFRQPVADRLVLILFGKRMLGTYDFDKDDDIITLNEEGFKKFCREYERWMTGRNVLAGENFRRKIQVQVGKLKKVFQDKVDYDPYMWSPEHVPD